MRRHDDCKGPVGAKAGGGTGDRTRSKYLVSIFFRLVSFKIVQRSGIDGGIVPIEVAWREWERLTPAERAKFLSLLRQWYEARCAPSLGQTAYLFWF
jgi:hypothetical protein